MGGVRRSRWRSRPLLRPRLTQATQKKDNLKRLFVAAFTMRAKTLGWNVDDDEPTYDIAWHYLTVARSTPCFVRLLAATGPASRHGRCARTAAF